MSLSNYVPLELALIYDYTVLNAYLPSFHIFMIEETLL